MYSTKSSRVWYCSHRYACPTREWKVLITDIWGSSSCVDNYSSFQTSDVLSIHEQLPILFTSLLPPSLWPAKSNNFALLGLSISWRSMHYAALKHWQVCRYACLWCARLFFVYTMYCSFCDNTRRLSRYSGIKYMNYVSRSKKNFCFLYFTVIKPKYEVSFFGERRRGKKTSADIADRYQHASTNDVAKRHSNILHSILLIGKREELILTSLKDSNNIAY
jgi:hypothetical protein